MSLFKKKPAATPAAVNIKIIGMLMGRYVSVMDEVGVPDGATVIDALKALQAKGVIDKNTFSLVKDVTHPLQLLINGARIEGPKPAKTALHQGDEVSILTATSGG